MKVYNTILELAPFFGYAWSGNYSSKWYEVAIVIELSNPYNAGKDISFGLAVIVFVLLIAANLSHWSARQFQKEYVYF